MRIRITVRWDRHTWGMAVPLSAEWEADVADDIEDAICAVEGEDKRGWEMHMYINYPSVKVPVWEWVRMMATRHAMQMEMWQRAIVLTAVEILAEKLEETADEARAYCTVANTGEARAWRGRWGECQGSDG